MIHYRILPVLVVLFGDVVFAEDDNLCVQESDRANRRNPSLLARRILVMRTVALLSKRVGFNLQPCYTNSSKTCNFEQF